MCHTKKIAFQILLASFGKGQSMTVRLTVHQLATQVVLVITDRQRSCGKVMFSQASVCSQGGRVSLVLGPFCGVGYPFCKVFSRWGCRVSLVPGPFCGVGYPWYQVLSGGRVSLGG